MKQVTVVFLNRFLSSTLRGESRLNWREINVRDDESIDDALKRETRSGDDDDTSLWDLEYVVFDTPPVTFRKDT